MNYSTIFTALFTVIIFVGILYTFYGTYQVKKLQQEMRDTVKQIKQNSDQ